MSDERKAKRSSDYEAELSELWKILMRPFDEKMWQYDSLKALLQHNSKEIINAMTIVFPIAIRHLSTSDIASYVKKLNDFEEVVNNYLQYLEKFQQSENKKNVLYAMSIFLKGFNNALFALQDHVETNYGVVPLMADTEVSFNMGTKLLESSYPYSGPITDLENYIP